MSTVERGTATSENGVRAGETFEGAGLPAEAKTTLHEIVSTLGPGSSGLDLLHRDLFDSRAEVVCSALEAIGKIADQRSLRFVVKLLGSKEQSVRREAVRTLGYFRLSATAKVLSDLYKTTAEDELRCETLRSLVRIMPTNAGLLRVLRERMGSPVSSPDLSSCCAVLLISVAPDNARAVLDAAPRTVIGPVLSWGLAHPESSVSIVAEGVERYGRLNPPDRKALIELAALAGAPRSGEAVVHGVADDDAEVRSASYRALGTTMLDPSGFSAVVASFLNRTEESYALEEEALSAIDHLEKRSGDISLDSTTLTRLQKWSRELYEQLAEKQPRAGSETIELGWLILRSREYLEYYGDEEFREALVHYLKGGIYYTPEQLLMMLKKSAERVEVKHFEGYRALADVIRNRKRPGMALVVRELHLAKLGKREPFGRLIRNLRLMRLSSELSRETKSFVGKVLDWARGEKLYRLAEAALYVMAKFNAEAATARCRELLRLPVESKILAIASIRLLGELDIAELDEAIVNLLASGSDSHILLNLIDSLDALDRTPRSSILGPMIALVRTAPDIEVSRRAAQFLSARPFANLLESLTEGFERLDRGHQEVVVDLIARGGFEAAKTRNAEGLAEFLYRILRDQKSSLRGRAAALLWRLGDDFAVKVIRDLLAANEVDAKIDIVRSLEGSVDGAIAPELYPLLPAAHVALQQALRSTLCSVTDETVARSIVEAVTGAEGGVSAASDDEVSADSLRAESGIFRERQAFRFEHEFMRDLAVLFTDIKGYSAKAQVLSTMEINSLIEDYEAILLPTMESHRGKLIKRMGDGHMFIFESPLDAGLAGLRLQKALKRFNSYREERLRVVVRAGVHWGQVVQRDGDVFGNNVNIASRLESSAKPGTVLVSKATFERMDGHIQAQALGKITVKNISEPISVYELSEIEIDLPEELDPLKSSGTDTAARAAGDGPAADAGREEVEEILVDTNAVRYFARVFTGLDELCVKVEKQEASLEGVRDEIARAWKRFRELAMKAQEKGASS